MNNTLQITINKIDKIIDFLGIIEEKSKIKENLIAGIYLQMVKQIGSNSNNRGLLLELSKNDPKTKEEFDRFFDYTQQKTIELGYDAGSELEKASKIVLENFIREMQNDLAPEKLTEIKKIILE